MTGGKCDDGAPGRRPRHHISGTSAWTERPARPGAPSTRTARASEAERCLHMPGVKPVAAASWRAVSCADGRARREDLARHRRSRPAGQTPARRRAAPLLESLMVVGRGTSSENHGPVSEGTSHSDNQACRDRGEEDRTHLALPATAVVASSDQPLPRASTRARQPGAESHDRRSLRSSTRRPLARPEPMQHPTRARCVRD